MPDDLDLLLDQVVDLGQRRAVLDTELATMKEKIRLLTGGEPPVRPTKRPTGLNGGRAAADGKVLDALKAAPGGLTQAELSKLTGAPMCSTGNRLSRLEAAGLATKDGHRWSPTASPPPSAPT
jgi:hypothetical protein